MAQQQAPAAIGRPEVRQALREHLLAIADDELILGHRHAEWTGFGPDIESDVALSSIAQEEMGHARLFYQQVLHLDGLDNEEIDALAFDRPPEGFRNAVFLERPNGDWGFSVVRLLLYDLADSVRLEVWSRTPLETIPGLARTLGREEKYHRMYGETWLNRLARATPGSHAHIQEAVDAAWGEALGLFEPVAGEAHLVGEGLLMEEAARQEKRWRAQVSELFEPLGLRLPSVPPSSGGRLGQHSPDLAALLDEMTSVRRLEPGATW